MSGGSARQPLFGKEGVSASTGRGGLPRTDDVPRTTVSLTDAQLHHSVPIKSSFLDECLCQAGPDASETCNYSWLPTPTVSAPVPVQGTSWPCLASCLLRDGRRGIIENPSSCYTLPPKCKNKTKNLNSPISIPSPTVPCQKKQININWLESSHSN